MLLSLFFRGARRVMLGSTNVFVRGGRVKMTLYDFVKLTRGVRGHVLMLIEISMHLVQCISGHTLFCAYL